MPMFFENESIVHGYVSVKYQRNPFKIMSKITPTTFAQEP